MEALRLFFHEVKYLFDETPPPFPSVNDLRHQTSLLVKYLSGTPYEPLSLQVQAGVEKLIFDGIQQKNALCEVKALLKRYNLD